MAGEGEEPEEYESDPEGTPLRLTMRRREASDDEAGEGDGEGERDGEKSPPPRWVDARSGIGSDVESDDQGGAQVYEEEEEEGEEGEEDAEDEEEVYDEEDVEEEEEPVIADAVDAGKVDDKGAVDLEVGADGGIQSAEDGQNPNEEEKKENEPFAVPTAGAFYMHDDRFRESQRGRHRRSGGRRLWESKDDRAWVHDRFEEMNLQDVHFDEERRSRRNQFRGRVKKRGSGRGYLRGRSKGYDDNVNQNRAPKSVRGRGPRKYDTLKNNNGQPRIQRKQTGKAYEATTNNNLGKPTGNQSYVPTVSVASTNHVFASSLSSASPPFYPSGASTQDLSFVPKRDPQAVDNGKRYPMLKEENLLSTPHSNSLLRGKGVVEATGQDRIYIEDSAHAVRAKAVVNMQPAKVAQPNHTRVQVRGISMSGSIPYQPASSTNQVARGSVEMQQIPPVSQKLPQSSAQPSFRASSQQVNLRMASGNQASPSQGPSVASSEAPEVQSPPGSARSKTAMAGKGKTSTQGAGSGSFLYNGAQIIAATGSHGDQSFQAQTILPATVMPFGGQSHGGLGVPAVRMALPGYVAQSQLGFGNSEMTWMPLLAGAATGALGATYCPPYIAVDGGYYALPSGQAPSGGVSKDTSSNKPGNDVSKPSQRTELLSEEFGQRQNKPRRYSEMNFGQW